MRRHCRKPERVFPGTAMCWAAGLPRYAPPAVARPPGRRTPGAVEKPGETDDGDGLRRHRDGGRRENSGFVAALAPQAIGANPGSSWASARGQPARRMHWRVNTGAGTSCSRQHIRPIQTRSGRCSPNCKAASDAPPRAPATRSGSLLASHSASPRIAPRFRSSWHCSRPISGRLKSV